MDHLNPETLVDLAEGARAESSEPHLAGCGACRRQVNELRAMMSAVEAAPVPEPSPLFWDHLSSRVREAVTAERRAWWEQLWTWPRVLVPAAVMLAVVVVAVAVNRRVAVGPVETTVAHGELLSAEDPSLGLVADLTGDLDWDRAREAGLAESGSAEHAVTHLSREELASLRRLLKEELARPVN